MISEVSELAVSTLLSQALVAFTIEFDNESEHRLAHRTTESRAGGKQDGPWLVSQVMWANVMRYVVAAGAGGITVVQLHAQARTAKDSLAGLTRWGYVRVADSVVTATREGRTAQRVWEPLAMEIESRWASRFEAAYQQLRGTLETFAAAIEVDFPDYLPITSPTQNGRLEPFRPLVTGVDPRGLDLSALLSRVLLAYTLDFERESAISLPVSANTLRVLDAEPIPLRDLPRLSGVLQPYPDGWRAKAGAPQALPHHPMVLHRGGFPDGS